MATYRITPIDGAVLGGSPCLDIEPDDIDALVDWQIAQGKSPY